MSFVPGNIQLLTPDEAKVILTEPCLRILVGDAQAIFLPRNRGKPSPWVWIIPIRGNRQPTVFVGRDQWEKAVVPVLLDPQWSTSSSLIKEALSGGQLAWLLEVFGNVLRQSFLDQGFGPRS
jgi:hypothetical protein